MHPTLNPTNSGTGGRAFGTVVVSPATLSHFAFQGDGGRRSGNVAAWPAILTPELLDPAIVEHIRHGLTTSFRATWQEPPRAGTYQTELEIVADTRRGEINQTTVVTSVVGPDAEGSATTTYRVEQGGREPAMGSHSSEIVPADADGMQSWSWTTTEAEAAEYCAAVGAPLARTDEFGWAGFPVWPATILPASLLAAKVLRRAKLPSSGTLSISYRRPVLAGAAMSWKSWHEPEGFFITASAVGSEVCSVVAVVRS